MARGPDWYVELDEALLNGILAKAEDFVHGGEDMPTEDDFRRATVALRMAREIARQVRKGQGNGSTRDGTDR